MIKTIPRDYKYGINHGLELIYFNSKEERDAKFEEAIETGYLFDKQANSIRKVVAEDDFTTLTNNQYKHK